LYRDFAIKYSIVAETGSPTRRAVSYPTPFRR
jgi:hypothetical protein